MKLTADKLSEWHEVMAIVASVLVEDVSVSERTLTQIERARDELRVAYLEAVREECGG